MTELEKAARDYAILPMDVGEGKVCIDRKEERAFKAGAEWMREQMMKGLCYETEIYIDDDGDGIETEFVQWPALKCSEIYKLPEDMEFNEGDKVKIIIVKED